MRILFLTSTLPRFAGDTQANFVREQADAWLAARPDHHITILAPHDVQAPYGERHGRLSIERFRYMVPATWQGLAYPAILPNIRRNPLLILQVIPFLMAQAKAAARVIREKRVDAVYAHWVMPQGIVAYWLKRRTGVPYFLQSHSSDLSIFGRLGPPGKLVAGKILRSSSGFFCVNSNQLEIAKSYHPPQGRSAFEAKSRVMPMGVADLADAEPTSDGADIGTIGRLSRKKGLDFLIGAAEKLAEAGVRPSISIAGDGEDASRLKSMVSRANVEFPGFLVGADKAAFLASCSRFAFPSKAADGDVEGMPVALLEALVHGRPVLASRDTNLELLPEWPQIKEAVVMVSDPSDIDALAEGLRQLLEKSPQSMAGAARLLRRYRWNELIEEYLALIEGRLDGWDSH